MVPPLMVLPPTTRAHLQSARTVALRKECETLRHSAFHKLRALHDFFSFTRGLQTAIEAAPLHSADVAAILEL